MAYTDCWLWQRAFVANRKDSSKKEQDYFRERYLSMREKAIQLASLIDSDLKNMTVHDQTHLDALWEMGSIVAEQRIDLSPPEAFVFGGSVLLHDAALTLAAYPGGEEELRETLYWKDSFARLQMEAADSDSLNNETLEKVATAETLRRLHASEAEKLPTRRWKTKSNDDPEYLIDDPEVRNFYGPKIGQIAQSHWWSVAKIQEDLATNLGALGGRTTNKIDSTKIACLLRIADAMHLDRRRAPSFLRKLLNPEGISEKHWIFQERMAVPYIEQDTLVYSAAPAFELQNADAWWLAYDALTNVDKELRSVDHLLQTRGTTRLKVNRVKGIDSPSELSTFVETTGWSPVNTTIRVSDVPRIVGTLGGRKLYGNKPTAALRELLQNGADAINARRRLQKRELDWGTLSVSLRSIDDKNWLVVEDNGIGMSSTVLTGPLIDFGNSFWRSQLAVEEFPGLHSSGISPRGHYGIGFFSIFMLGKKVLVTSRRFDKASDSAQTLEFQDGLGSRPILYPADITNLPVDGGTRMSVMLDRDLREESGLLQTNEWEDDKTLAQLVASIAPNLDVTIIVKEGEATETVVKPGDWLDINEQNFIARLAARKTEDKQKKASRLRTLLGSDGTIFGRAAIETNEYGSYEGGCITIGGLRASDIGAIRGVLVGREHTAARNDAFIVVPPNTLSEWATEQGKLINRASLPAEDKARGANVILQFGGLVGNLPVARWEGNWISIKELTEILSQIDSISVFTGSVKYDEDVDDVHPREFAHHFKESSEVLFVPDEIPGFKRDLQEHFMYEHEKFDTPSTLLELIERLIAEKWVSHDEDLEDETVGTVFSNNIVRQVSRFTRDDSFS